MKKNLFLLAAILLLSSISQAQLEIIAEGGSTSLNGDTLVVDGAKTGEMNQNLYVINTNSHFSETIAARRDSLSLPIRDTDNTFCWAGLCYATTSDTSEFYETINGGDTAKGINEFTGHYFPYGYMAPAFIRYTFINTANRSDSTWVVLEYHPVPTGIQNIASENVNLSVPYPNPANNAVNFNYSLSSGVQAGNLKIFNLLGECIQTTPLSSSKSKATINVQSIPSGVYVCEIEAAGIKPAYQKLIVSH